MNAVLLRQFFRFATVGTVGFVVNAGIVEGLSHTLGLMGSQMLAFPLAASVTWALNRQFTFGRSDYALHHEWLRYILSNLLGWVANNGTYAAMVFTLPLARQYPVLAVAAGSIAGMFLNFAASRQLVFKARPA